MRPIILSLIFLSGCASAQLDSSITAGVGKNIVTKQPGGFERFGSLGVRYGDVWKLQANGGYWLAQAEGERASWFGSLQGGLQVVGASGVYATFMFGPAWISQDDSKLTGHFQFHPVFGFGVKNVGGFDLGGEWQHFSNAGIAQPNMGRDIICLTAKIPLWRGDK